MDAGKNMLSCAGCIQKKYSARDIWSRAMIFTFKQTMIFMNSLMILFMFSELLSIKYDDSDKLLYWIMMIQRNGFLIR